MSNMLYDFIPVILFFVAFKVYGIYVATVVGIVATALQVVVTFLWKKRLDKQQFVTLIIFALFGGMTLYFHDPLFVKWKPTVIYWIFAIILFFSHFIGNKTIIQRMLEKVMDNHAGIPPTMWTRLNIAWTLFFLTLGGINLYVAYSFSTDAWVNFKLYGTLSLLLGFSFLQAMCLAKYMTESK
jgi:intracellular septation protein